VETKPETGAADGYQLQCRDRHSKEKGGARETRIMSKTRSDFPWHRRVAKRGSRKFSHENKFLRDLFAGVTPAQDIEPHHRLAPGVWLDFEPDKGAVVSVTAGDDGQGLRIRATDLADSHWFSLSYPVSRGNLKTARYLGFVLENTSQGLAAFRPCLRYHLTDGFKDYFARDMIVLSGTAQTDLTFVAVDQALLAQARSTEVLFFFEGRAFDVTLNSIENLHI